MKKRAGVFVMGKGRSSSGLIGGLVALLMLPGMSVAKVLDCDRLEGGQKAICEDLAMCSLIGNSNARTQCVGAVLVSEQRQAARTTTPTTTATSAPRPPETSVAPVVAPAVIAEATDQVIVKIRPRSEDADQPVRVSPQSSEEDQPDKRIAIRRIQDIEIPRRFRAVVQSVRHQLRNRQVVLLDNDLLFDGEGQYDVGTEVSVVRKRLGGRFIMTHKSGNDEFDRIECERPDSGLKKQERTWCNLFFQEEP